MIMGNTRWTNRVIVPCISSLSSNADWKRNETSSKLMTKASDLMGFSDRASNFHSTLWFSKTDIDNQIPEKILACGQFSICYELYLWSPEHKGHHSNMTKVLGQLKADSMIERLNGDWEKFKKLLTDGGFENNSKIQIMATRFHAYHLNGKEIAMSYAYGNIFLLVGAHYLESFKKRLQREMKIMNVTTISCLFIPEWSEAYCGDGTLLGQLLKELCPTQSSFPNGTVKNNLLYDVNRILSNIKRTNRMPMCNAFTMKTKTSQA